MPESVDLRRTNFAVRRMKATSMLSSIEVSSPSSSSSHSSRLRRTWTLGISSSSSSSSSSILYSSLHTSTGGGGMTPRQLSDALKYATSLRVLDTYVSQHGADMDERHVSAALSRLVKLEEALSPEGGLTPAAAPLFHHLRDMLSQPQSPHGLSRIELLNSRGVSNTLWAIVKGGGDSATPEVKRLVAILCAEDHAVVAGCSAQHLANAAWAVGRVFEQARGTVPSQQLKALFGAILTEWRGGAGAWGSSQNVANMMTAFSKVRCLDAVLARELCDQILMPGRQNLLPQHLSSMLYSCAARGYLEPARARPLWAAVERLGLPGFPIRSLSNILRACATGKWVDMEHTRAVCGAAMVRPLSEWNAQDVANTLWALATLAISSPASMKRMLGEAEVQDLLRVLNQQVVAGVYEFTPADWSRVVWARDAWMGYDHKLLEGAEV